MSKNKIDEGFSDFMKDPFSLKAKAKQKTIDGLLNSIQQGCGGPDYPGCDKSIIDSILKISNDEEKIEKLKNLVAYIQKDTQRETDRRNKLADEKAKAAKAKTQANKSAHREHIKTREFQAFYDDLLSKKDEVSEEVLRKEYVKYINGLRNRTQDNPEELITSLQDNMPEELKRILRIPSIGAGRSVQENKKGIKSMTLTKDVLKRIIKEELEKLTADMATEEEDSVDSEIAELEKQLAEAKKAKAMKKMKGAHADHKMKPLKSKK